MIVDNDARDDDIETYGRVAEIVPELAFCSADVILAPAICRVTIIPLIMMWYNMGINAVTEMWPLFYWNKNERHRHRLMNGQEVAVMIGSVLGGGGLGAFITKIWNQKRLDGKQNVNNFQTLFNEISKDVGRVRDEQAEERKQWAEERKAFNLKIDKLNELIRNQDKALHAKEVEVTELRGQVNLLQSQLDTYREVHTSAKNVTIKT